MTDEPMRCFHCRARMVAEVHHGVEIDRCTWCQALWFDPSEIGDYLANRTGGSFRTPTDEDFLSVAGDSPVACPGCHEIQFAQGWLNMVEFHRCAACGGMLVSTEAVFKAAESGTINLQPHVGYVESAVELTERLAAPIRPEALLGYLAEFVHWFVVATGHILKGR